MTGMSRTSVSGRRSARHDPPTDDHPDHHERAESANTTIGTHSISAYLPGIQANAFFGRYSITIVGPPRNVLKSHCYRRRRAEWPIYPGEESAAQTSSSTPIAIGRGKVVPGAVEYRISTVGR